MSVAPAGATRVSCDDRVSPGAAEARLLTRLQYDNTVRDLLGDSSAPAQSFPAENTLLGFGNNASVHRESLLLAERQLTAAESVAAAAVARGVDALLPCSAGDRSDACVTNFVTTFGYRAFRRPLRDGESQPFVDLFQQAKTEWGFDAALTMVIQAFLQAPQFLYRPESLTTGDDTPEGMTAGATIGLDSYQVASRLSYFLWNTMPDAELFALADQSKLSSEDTVREQARRMLEDDKARTTVGDFYAQWLGVTSFPGLTRNAPDGTATGAYDDVWAKSLAAFGQHTFWDEGGTLAALFTSKSVFLDSSLAVLYGFDANAGGALSRDAVTSLFEDPNRSGILTQPALMALLAHAEQSAPVQRGKFVREQVLCQILPPPPPDVDTTPPDPDPKATTRERFKEHSANERCASCHRLLDQVGFGFEEFDQLGRFRAEENGFPVDSSGTVFDAGDPTVDGAFDGASDLSAKLAASPQVEACMATQWFRYGMGRAEQTDDSCNLERVKSAFSGSGGDFKELLVSLATSDAFRYRVAGNQDL